MRYIAVFLVLANFAYFGWDRYRPNLSNVSLAGESRPLLNNGLMLVSEFNLQTEALQTASAQCYLAGNFPSIDEAKYFMFMAESMGLNPQLNLTGEPLESHYRVYIPPLSSRAVAMVRLDGLAESIANAGLQLETHLVTRGVLENAIALEVYAGLGRAAAARDQLAELGYAAEIEEIPQFTGDIQVQLRPQASPQIETAEWLELTVDQPYLTATENLCETIAQGAQFP